MLHGSFSQIASLKQGDKLVRATELAKLLTLEKSMKGALTLVTRLKLPILQEKFSSLLEVIAVALIFFNPE
jgi:chromosome transmission fidelity protein 4